MDNEFNKSNNQPTTGDSGPVPHATSDTSVLLGASASVTAGNQSTENVHTIAKDNTYTQYYANQSSSFGAGTSVYPFSSSLEREVKLTELSISIATSTYLGKIQIWEDWRNHPFIKDKLRNFAYIKCNLVVRIVPSFSPFHYGNFMCVYSPYHNSNTIASQAYDTRASAYWNRANFQQYISTFPIKGMIKASENNIVELTIPFISSRNYISVAHDTPDAVDDLGTLIYYTLNDFHMANPNATDAAKIAFFVRATDIELSVPTIMEQTSGTMKPKSKASTPKKKVKFTATGSVTEKDETDEANGIVSGPASAIAKAADALAAIPVIGKFARATSIGASAVGNIAKLFGFSNPPMIAGAAPVNLRLFSNTATTSGLSTAAPLSLDPKCELTVDPTVVGAEPTDDMAFSSIVQREQWVTAGRWLGAVGQFVTAGATTAILSTTVCSTVCRKSGPDAGGNTYGQLNPAGYIGEVFRFWRGSIIYRLEVVASKYHSGALLIAFDPCSNNAAPAITDLVSTDVTRRSIVILDISEAHEAEIEIDYVSSEIFLKNRSVTQNSFNPRQDNTTAFDIHTIFDAEKDMGVLTVSVLNPLVAPGDTSVYGGTGAGVEVNLYMRCGPDMRFAQPSSIDNWENFRFELTSGTLKLVDTPADDDMLTCFGESVYSLRSLLKRPMIASMITPQTTQVVIGGTAAMYFPFFANDRPTDRRTFESYFAPAFLAKRGSMRWKFIMTNSFYDDGTSPIPIGNNTGGVAIIGRESSDSAVNRAPTYSSSDNWATLPISTFPSGSQGIEITDLAYKPSVDVQLPFYSSNRFALAGALGATTATQYTVNPTMDQVLYSKLAVWAVGASNMKVTALASTGEDYSLIMFLGVPPIFYTA